ncbi:MAG: hypothetical protein ABJE95_27025 [Byssovorax sp.]
MIWIGVGIAVLLALVVAVVVLGGSGPAFKPGTRAFEAYLTLDPLVKTIASRKQELASETHEGKKDRLTREIAFLERQIPELQAIVDAKDSSPGRGYIGFDNLPKD